jgi:hypothetical protein
MLRAVVYLLLTIFLVTFLRAAIGLIGKAVAQLFQPSAPNRPGTRGATAGGELKQCATCGVYSSKNSSLERVIGGKTLYFCSTACRDKYQG